MKRVILFAAVLFITLTQIFAQDDDQKSGLITGSIISRMSQQPLIGITVMLQGTKIGTKSDVDGKFVIKNAPVGFYSLKFSGVGYETYIETNVPVRSGKPTQLDVELVEKFVEIKGAEVKASYFIKPVETVTSSQILNSQDIRRAPGVQEDVVRATALLPGVAVTQAGRNDLIVRGGAPFENLFIVDNIEVPNINHFGSQGSTGGPLSIINIDFTRNVRFSAGGFGAKYGDKTSAITNIKLRHGNEEYFAGEANLSATGFGLSLEGPFGSEGSSYLFSVRRSYLDLIFKAAGFAFIPQYWDFQGKVKYKLNDFNYLEFLAIGALNDVTLNNDELDQRFDNSRFAVPRQNQYFSGLTWKHIFKSGFATITLGRNYTQFKTFQNDSNLTEVFRNESKESETILRTDLDLTLGEKSGLTFGNQIKYGGNIEYDVKIPGYIRTDQNGIPRPLNTDTSLSIYKNATYANWNSSFGHHRFNIGARADYYNFTKDKLFFSPRVSYSYRINNLSNIIFSAGRYYQSPQYIWLIGGSEQELNPFRADQVVVGYDHTPLQDVKVQIEFYHKWYGDYPARVYRPQAVLAPSGFDDALTDIPFGLEPLANEGEGLSRGFEIFIQKKFSETPFYGLFSLSVSETKFKSLDGVERPGAFDTRFIMNVAGGYRFDEEWEASAKFRAASGLPTTPFTADGSYDFARYNEGERLPFFHSLDARVDKRWYLENYSFITYIDIQNIYAQKNVSAIRWNPRTGEPEYNESLGIFPTIGVTFEF